MRSMIDGGTFVCGKGWALSIVDGICGRAESSCELDKALLSLSSIHGAYAGDDDCAQTSENEDTQNNNVNK